MIKKEEILSNLDMLVDHLEKNTTLNDEIDDLNNKLNALQTEAESLVLTNSKVVQDQTTYQETYDKHVRNYETL